MDASSHRLQRNVDGLNHQVHAQAPPIQPHRRKRRGRHGPQRSRPRTGALAPSQPRPCDRRRRRRLRSSARLRIRSLQRLLLRRRIRRRHRPDQPGRTRHGSNDSSTCSATRYVRGRSWAARRRRRTSPLDYGRAARSRPTGRPSATLVGGNPSHFRPHAGRASACIDYSRR